MQGEVPNPLNPPQRCTFNPRCPHANERCRSERPKLLDIDGVRVACHAVEERRICGSGRRRVAGVEEMFAAGEVCE